MMVSLDEALCLGWGGIEGAARQFPLKKETENLPLGCPSNHPKYTKFFTGEITPNKRNMKFQWDHASGACWLPLQPELKRLTCLPTL